MSAMWGRERNDDREGDFFAWCPECGWGETTNRAGADGVMTVASLSRQHNAVEHDERQESFDLAVTHE